MMDEEQNLRGLPERQGNPFREMIRVDCSYILRNWIGRLKLIEFIFVTLAGIILPSTVSLFFTRFAFFTFVVWTSFMYLVIDLLLHVLSLWRRLPVLMTSSSILTTPLIMGSFAFLISSALVAHAAHTLPGSAGAKAGIAAACGFVVMVLFAVEVFLHYRFANAENTEVERPRNPARNRPISHPVMVDVVDPPAYKDINSGENQPYIPPSTFE